MSINFVYPTMMGIPESKAYFWVPQLNENTQLTEGALTPAIATFKAGARFKCGDPAWLQGTATTGFTVSTTPSDILAGIAAGPTRADSRVIVKMFGVGHVRGTVPFEPAHVGQLLRGTVSSVAPSVGTTGVIGEVISGSGDMFTVALRVGRPNTFKSTVSSVKQVLEPGVFFPTAGPKSGGFGTITGIVSVDRNATTPVIATQLGGASIQSAIALSYNKPLISWDTTGIHIQHTKKMLRNFCTANVVSTSTAAIQDTALRCSMSDYTVHLRSSNWFGNPLLPATPVFIQYAVTGFTETKNHADV